MRALIFLSLFLITSLAGCKKDDAAKEAGAPVPVKPAAEAPKPAASARVVPLEVTSDGFVPANVSLKAHEPVTLRVTRKTDETCATEILIDGTDINVKLPLNTAVDVAYTPTKAGSVKFGCAMDKMVGGVLLVE
ncbi:MAG: cupredoxin domain-containing protein [Myxococcota bacterium]